MKTKNRKVRPQRETEKSKILINKIYINKETRRKQ